MRKVLYRLPELLAADPTQTVFVVEGEKDADRLAGLGLVATTNVGGAGKWKPEYSEALRGRNVVILRDNDEAGRLHAEKVSTDLQGVAASVKVLLLPDLPEKGDVSDWLDAGGSAEKLLALVEQTPEWDGKHNAPNNGTNRTNETNPSLSSSGDLEEIDAMDLKAAEISEEIESLPLLGLDGHIIKRLANVVSAPPKCGKTELIYQCLNGWLEQGETVLYFTEEPRLVWQHRLNVLDVIGQRGLMLVFGLGMDVAKMLERSRNGSETVIVIDTLRGLGILPEEENDNGAVARALEPWLSLCRQGEKTLIGLHHDRKTGGRHGQGVSGAHSLVGAVDMLLQIRHGSPDNRRIVSTLGRLVQPPEFTYERLQDGTMRALGEADIPADAKPRHKKANLIALLPDKPPGITMEALILAAKVSKPTALEQLENEAVIRTGSGKRGDPFLYYRKA